MKEVYKYKETGVRGFGEKLNSGMILFRPFIIPQSVRVTQYSVEKCEGAEAIYPGCEAKDKDGVYSKVLDVFQYSFLCSTENRVPFSMTFEQAKDKGWEVVEDEKPEEPEKEKFTCKHCGSEVAGGREVNIQAEACTECVKGEIKFKELENNPELEGSWGCYDQWYTYKEMCKEHKDLFISDENRKVRKRVKKVKCLNKMEVADKRQNGHSMFWLFNDPNKLIKTKYVAIDFGADDPFYGIHAGLFFKYCTAEDPRGRFVIDLNGNPLAREAKFDEVITDLHSWLEPGKLKADGPDPINYHNGEK